MQLAAQHDPDRMPQLVRQIELSAGETEQGQALTLFREKVERILSEDVGRTSAGQQSDEPKRVLFLDFAQLVLELSPIDLMDVHGLISTAALRSEERRVGKECR